MYPCGQNSKNSGEVRGGFGQLNHFANMYTLKWPTTTRQSLSWRLLFFLHCGERTMWYTYIREVLNTDISTI